MQYHTSIPFPKLKSVELQGFRVHDARFTGDGGRLLILTDRFVSLWDWRRGAMLCVHPISTNLAVTGKGRGHLLPDPRNGHAFVTVGVARVADKEKDKEKDKIGAGQTDSARSCSP